MNWERMDLVEPYIKMQRGAYEKENYPFNYQETTELGFEGLKEYLPEPQKDMVFLDIGGGVGGYDLLISKHYPEDPPHIFIVDGEDDPPVRPKDYQKYNTLNGGKVATQWHFANDVHNLHYVSPERFLTRFSGQVDFVLSTGSWCFHYHPHFYLGKVRKFLKTGHLMILDVRKGREWERELDPYFEQVAVILEDPKLNRIVWRKR